jgi:hypothetical protein
MKLSLSYFMAAKFESEPRKMTESFLPIEGKFSRPTTMMDILEDYRAYMHDETAQLPAELEQHLLSIGTEDDRKD